MQIDMGIKLMKMNADGPMGVNNLLMQLQADLCGVPVRKCFFHSLFLNLFSRFLFIINKLKERTLSHSDMSSQYLNTIIKLLKK